LVTWLLEHPVSEDEVGRFLGFIFSWLNLTNPFENRTRALIVLAELHFQRAKLFICKLSFHS
jgi:hypothetical protein